MINCSVLGLGSFSSQLMNELLQAVIQINSTDDARELVPLDKISQMRKWLSLWRETAEEFEWHHIVSSIDRLNTQLSKNPTFKELEYGLKSINDGLQDGLKAQLVYRYPNDKAKIVLNWKNDWENVLSRLPECGGDVFASVDLWALGHYTASVFHMMRVLEYGLGALAREVGVKYDNQVWYNVINEIEAAIKSERNSILKGNDRKNRLNFLSEAAKEFVYFKDGWRNYVSHNKAIYDEPQARRVLEHVRHFMNILTDKIELKPGIS